MFNHNLFTLLKEFSGEELVKFDSFLKSPYHNKSRKVIRAFKEIKKFHPEFADKKLTKEYLGKKINPSIKFHDSTVRDLMSELLRKAGEFLAMEEFRKSKEGKAEHALKSLVSKNQSVLFEKLITEFRNDLENTGIDGKYFYTKSRIDLNRFNFNMINRHKKSSEMISNNRAIIISYTTSLLNHFITEFINAYIHLYVYDSKFQSRNNIDIVSKLFECMDIEEIVKIFRKNDKHNFVLEIYSALFFTFRDLENEKHYSKYKSLYFKYSKRLSKDERAFHFSMLMTYCIFKISAEIKKSGFDSELFSLFKFFLEKKYFMDNKSNYLEEDLFRNILLTGIRLKEYAWVLNFIKIYSKHLHPSKKKNWLNYSYAEYYYHYGSSRNSVTDLNKSFEFLREIQDEMFIVKFDVRILYLMLYYDLNYNEPLYTQINNYRKFLHRNTLLTKDKKDRNNQFLNLLEKLLKVKFKDGDVELKSAELHVAIMKIRNVDHKVWFLRKFENLGLLKYSYESKTRLGKVN